MIFVGDNGDARAAELMAAKKAELPEFQALYPEFDFVFVGDIRPRPRPPRGTAHARRPPRRCRAALTSYLKRVVSRNDRPPPPGEGTHTVTGLTELEAVGAPGPNSRRTPSEHIRRRQPEAELMAAASPPREVDSERAMPCGAHRPHASWPAQ